MAESRLRGAQDLADNYKAICLALQDDNSILEDTIREVNLQKDEIQERLDQLESENISLEKQIEEMSIEKREMQQMLIEAHNEVNQKHQELDDCKASMESIVRVVIEEAGNEEAIRATLDEENDHLNMAAILEQMLASEDSGPQTELLEAKESLEIKVRALEKDVEAEREKLTCQICYDKERNIICLPCKHFLFCSLCLRISRESNEIDKCPVCQTAIIDVLDVYR